jgi:aryl-alcohol dehydrogenase-like predicted oxidoreductase
MANKYIPNLILGTVQLGTKYGIANKEGKPSLAQTFEIVETALANGINTFDTAIAYGDAEARIGQALALLGCDTVRMVTKIGSSSLSSSANCAREVRQSLERLHVKKLHAVLTHSFDDIHRPAVGAILNEIKQRELVEFTGASVYTAGEAIRCLSLPWVDVVQMPLNAFDRQAEQKDVFNYARQSGKQLHFRSIYLQGLLLLTPEHAPQAMKAAFPALRKWNAICQEHGVSQSHAALQIAAVLAQEFPLVVGCETVKQLLDNVQMIKQPIPSLPELLIELETITPLLTEDLTNPSRWPTEALV